MMTSPVFRRFWRSDHAASAAEFALVLPVFLVFLLGTIDVGRFIWAVNESEKATQAGARLAVVSDVIPGGEIGCSDTGNNNTTPGLLCYSYALSGNVPQGSPVPKSAFPTVTCSAPGGSLGCTATSAPFSTAIDASAQAAFDNVVARVNDLQPRADADNVIISYAWSGLGFAGDPNGPDVAPTITVSLTGLQFRPIFLAGIFDFGLPAQSYSLTMEDGQG